MRFGPGYPSMAAIARGGAGRYWQPDNAAIHALHTPWHEASPSHSWNNGPSDISTNERYHTRVKSPQDSPIIRGLWRKPPVSTFKCLPISWVYCFLLISIAGGLSRFFFASFLFDRIVGKFSIENYVGFRRALIWFCAWLNQENQLETENMKNQNSDALDASGFSWPPLSWSPAHDETSI